MTAAELDKKLWSLIGTGNIRALRDTYDLFIIANNRQRRAKKRKRLRAEVKQYRLPKLPKPPKPRPEPKKSSTHSLTITEFRALPIQPYG